VGWFPPSSCTGLVPNSEAILDVRTVNVPCTLTLVAVSPSRNLLLPLPGLEFFFNMFFLIAVGGCLQKRLNATRFPPTLSYDCRNRTCRRGKSPIFHPRNVSASHGLPRFLGDLFSLCWPLDTRAPYLPVDPRRPLLPLPPPLAQLFRAFFGPPLFPSQRAEILSPAPPVAWPVFFG